MTEWVMVPREPTEAMIRAIAHRVADPSESAFSIYDDMLDAAPAAPVQQAEPVAHVTVEHFRGDPAMRNIDCDLVADLPPGTHALYLHPPAAEVQRMRDALDEIERETQDVRIQQIARRALEGK